MLSQEQNDKIWNIVKDTKVGMLTTRIGDSMHSRPMHLIQDKYNGHLFFYTSVMSEKIFEIGKEKEVCVTFADPNSDVFASLSGLATLVQDRDLIDRYWNLFVGAWFPEGKDSGDVALLDIEIHTAEYWDSTSSKLLQYFEIAKANLTNKTPKMGENEKFGTFQ